MRTNSAAMIIDDCATCGGRIYAQRTLMADGYTGGWLHFRREDWVTNVHQAVPTTKTIPEETRS